MNIERNRIKIPCVGCYIVDNKITQKEAYELMIKEKLKDEIWKDVNGSDGRYQISNYGRIRKCIKNKFKLLMPYIKKNKWLHIKVVVDGKLKEFAVHKLIAKHFIENEHGYKNVYHKNENIYDNHADNLAWIDSVELGRKTGYKSKAIPVLKIDPDTGDILDEYVSMAEAGRFNYLHRETIRQCIKGRLNTAGGFKWAVDKSF